VKVEFGRLNWRIVGALALGVLIGGTDAFGWFTGPHADGRHEARAVVVQAAAADEVRVVRRQIVAARTHAEAARERVVASRAQASRTARSVASLQQPVRILLVRHGETADDDTRDPPLSEAGVQRGEMLAAMLATAGVTQVYSTDYKRTRGIGESVAVAAGVAVEQYDPTALDDFAAQLKASSGLIVVVGHSNTTPALVQALGGEPGTPIDEPTEYDRLYIVVPQRDASGASTVLLRYGLTASPRPRGSLRP
jgi:phosphohistidine phosphatase SixA